MRIMLDTNVFISALLFPGQKFDLLMNDIFTKHQLVMSNFILDEIRMVVQKKFPQKVPALETFLSAIQYDIVFVPCNSDEQLVEIRDANDYPVIFGAIIGNVDVLVIAPSNISKFRD